MSVDPNWARWIFASVSKHFDDRRGNLPLYIEGQHRETRDLKNYLELRMDGPNWAEVSKGCWIGDVEINILISTAFDDNDYHRSHQFGGNIQAAFTNINAYKFGDGIEDTQEFLGCLRLKQDISGRDFIEFNYFGRRAIDDPIVQATVEGHYKIELLR